MSLNKSFSRWLFDHQQVIFMSLLLVALLCLPMSSFATEGQDIGFNKQLDAFVKVLSGKTTTLVCVVGVFFAGAMLIFGGDLGSFGRTIMMIVLVGSLLGTAVSFASKFMASGMLLL